MSKLLPILLLFAYDSLAQNFPLPNKKDGSPENTCNYAGSYKRGALIGQSTDFASEPVFLCFGDSLFLDHNGDALLIGDPNPSTAPGVVWAMYSCQPTVNGETLAKIKADPCVLSNSPSGLFIWPTLNTEGDVWLTNTGQLQTAFNFGKPVQIYLAPITIDDHESSTYESSIIGAPPGPCVNVNTDLALPVVFLNKISVSGVSNNHLDDCSGRFVVRGGYPQWEASATYDIQIAHATDPNASVQLKVPDNQLFELASVTFSVSEPGPYLVNITDQKSCGHQFVMDMSGCNPSDNVVLDFGEEEGKVGEAVCVPLRVRNFDIGSCSFSAKWDPAQLKYQGFSNVHPQIAPFFSPDTLVNAALANQGKLGIILFNTWSLGAPIVVPDNETLFELCFEVLSPAPAGCSQIAVSNNPVPVVFEKITGFQASVSTYPGSICQSLSAHQANPAEKLVMFPNPVKAGETVLVQTTAVKAWSLHFSNGAVALRENSPVLGSGNNLPVQTTGLAPGLYWLRIDTANAEPLWAKLVIVR